MLLRKYTAGWKSVCRADTCGGFLVWWACQLTPMVTYPNGHVSVIWQLSESTVSILFSKCSHFNFIQCLELCRSTSLSFWELFQFCHRNSLCSSGQPLTSNNSTVWPSRVPYSCEAPMAGLREFFIYTCKRIQSSKSYHSGKCGQKVTCIPGLFIWEAKFIGSLSKACNIRNMSTVSSLNLTCKKNIPGHQCNKQNFWSFYKKKLV